ncbi:hypothetical protein SAMN05216480_105170 [Pustulibacterium marinum]|uniref:Entericidin EcnA/B family protein n=1 Tax=Pustulibacterium marinum TaxID=1224947 RepID=A0A1I7GQA6_9FLAO|nr:hypothetical protein [Pustulibacterium marinum]SFU50625.1 hypothetical protein SAMN05216480_105170 [Pustulibacterium marinum]
MKKTFLTVMVMFMTLSTATTFVSCRENKTTGEKIEDAADDVGDEVEDAADEMEDAVD